MAKNGGYLLVDVDKCFDLKFNTDPYVDLMSQNSELKNLWLNIGNILTKNMFKGNKPIILCNLKSIDSSEILYDYKFTPINAFTCFDDPSSTLTLYYNISDADGRTSLWKFVFDLNEDYTTSDVTLSIY